MKNDLLMYLESEQIPKYKILYGDFDKVIRDFDTVIKYYFLSLDRIEYAFYSGTYSYPIYMLYNDLMVASFAVNKKTMVGLLHDMEGSLDIITDNEFYSEVLRVKEMIKLHKQGTIKI